MHRRWIAASRASGRKSTGASWYVVCSYDSMTPYTIPQMTSIRHGLRVIQCADISQHDWHGGQILCNLPPSSQAHAVLIDFSATMQTIDINVNVSKDDYGKCVSAITRLKNTGMDMKWVCEYWDRDEMKRECWDAYGMSLGTFGDNGYSWRSAVEDPYKFVYDGLD
jgi:hypothetical protein